MVNIVLYVLTLGLVYLGWDQVSLDASLSQTSKGGNNDPLVPTSKAGRNDRWTEQDSRVEDRPDVIEHFKELEVNAMSLETLQTFNTAAIPWSSLC